MSNVDPTAFNDPVKNYEIKVQGVLAARWSAWFDGLTIDTSAGDGTTVIRGQIVDQAALHGLLQKLRDVGVPLISLTELPSESTRATRTPRRPDMTMIHTAPAITASERATMSPIRKSALIAGVAYIATFLFSIPVKFGLWTDVLDKPDWVLGAGSDSGVPLGALFEVLTAHHGRDHRRRPVLSRPAVTASVPRSGSSLPVSWRQP